MIETPSTPRKKDAGLTQAAFDQLLACLGPDRESAASAYVALRGALFTYFAARGATDPDLLADETFDRVARRLSEGQTITTASPANYFYGVARNIWHESLARAKAVTQWSDETAARLGSAPTAQDVLLEAFDARVSEKRLACLEKCLAQLPAEDQALIAGYYPDLSSEAARQREALALQFGISVDALRHRVARLRSKLGLCISRCMRR